MGVLLMSMTAGGLIVAVILFAFAAFTGKGWLKKFVAGGALIWLAGYAILLVAASALSEEKTLGLGERKSFCGFYLDCHLHAEVTGVRRAKSYANQAAEGDFYIVSVKVSSDAERAELRLDAPKFEVVDARGRRFKRVVDLTVSGDPFEEKLPPGAALEAEAVFDLPADARDPRLDISEGFGLGKAAETILIGDEDSVLHKRSYFRLEPAAAEETASAN